MNPQPYIPGLGPAEPGPLSRFLPPLEQGVISTWLSLQSLKGNWLLDPFGFSPRLIIEAARAGYRVLVTANNPVNRFLIETFANPPAESEFVAALADIGAVKKGDERLEVHFQSLYSTTCEKCSQQIQAESFLWRKGEDAPYARVYECKYCGDSGERISTEDDLARAKKIAATDILHRSRAFEKVAALHDPDRVYAEEAIEHYLPRPLYVLTTIISRLDSLKLSPERLRALHALLLVACDAGNTLWAHPAERPRPKQLTTSTQFREHNVWLQLERGLSLWTETGSSVVCEAWPSKIPEEGGILIYEGRLKELAHEVKKEIPVAAVITSVPRPNQAFWTLSALWAGWLWGREAVEPYKVALRRRRYDWGWNATALNSAFHHLSELLPDNTPMFGLLPEPEPAFLTSVLSAANTSGFLLQSIALRTIHDPVQVIWTWKPIKRTHSMRDETKIKKAMITFLQNRGEPAGYLHIHAAGLISLTNENALKQPAEEFDESIRNTQNLLESILKDDLSFVHYSTGEGVETGMWGLNQPNTEESLSDRVEIAIVTFLQKNPDALFLDIENEINPKFTGLTTPSKGLIYAILNSYALKESGYWNLRAEDMASARKDELANMYDLLDGIGKRLGYQTGRDEKTLFWEDDQKPAFLFYPLASALIGRALDASAVNTIIVLPGSRAALAAYKQQRDPSLAARTKNYRIVKYRLLRAIAELPILTRETFEEQLASDPVEHSSGQMMMF